MNSYDVSIIIPARNEAAYIGSCLDAIAAQQADVRIEVIVVDNGSTDDTALIAGEQGAYVHHEATPGVGLARRAGTALATGTYIMHVDADTQLPASYIADALARFEQDIDLVCLGGRIEWHDESEFLNTIMRPVHALFVYYFRFLSQGALGPMGNNMMFLRSHYEQTNGFDETLKFGEDGDLTKQLSVFGKVRLDLSLLCMASSRRYRSFRDVCMYILNASKLCVSSRPFTNSLRPSDAPRSHH